MINYFYNIILKTDSCDLYSDVLTSVRKDFYLSREKQKGKVTQNSSGDSLFYEFSIEKDKPIKWSVSNSKSIISDCKSLVDGQSCVNFYGENGLYKAITFSKFQTLLKVEYFNMAKNSEPYCTIEPRKAGNGLCLLLSSRENIKPTVLHPMPDIDDDYILDKVELEFDEYTVVASTNDGVVKFLSESQLEVFEEFVDRAMAMKLTDTAPESFIEENEAVLAQKLNPKDFNVKRNLSEIVDISQAQEFSYDNIEEELVSDLVIEDVVPVEDEEVEDCTEISDASIELEETADIEEILSVEDEAETLVEELDVPIEPEVSVDTIEVFEGKVVAEEIPNEAVEEIQIQEAIEATEELDKATIEDTVEENETSSIEELLAETDASFDVEVIDDFEIGETHTPDRVIESSSAKYLYFGELNDNGERSGFGRTATEDGKTAYEGGYLHNKRNGVGAYYYKDSTLCYYGNWQDNKREGFGIGISSFDNSVHVGEFSDNKPFGDGVRIGKDGDIKFIKKVLSNGVTVELSFDGDKINVSKFDENGELISENTSNLMYF